MAWSKTTDWQGMRGVIRHLAAIVAAVLAAVGAAQSAEPARDEIRIGKSKEGEASQRAAGVRATREALPALNAWYRLSTHSVQVSADFAAVQPKQWEGGSIRAVLRFAELPWFRSGRGVPVASGQANPFPIKLEGIPLAPQKPGRNAYVAKDASLVADLGMQSYGRYDRLSGLRVLEIPLKAPLARGR